MVTNFSVYFKKCIVFNFIRENFQIKTVFKPPKNNNIPGFFLINCKIYYDYSFYHSFFVHYFVKRIYFNLATDKKPQITADKSRGHTNYITRKYQYICLTMYIITINIIHHKNSYLFLVYNSPDTFSLYH